MFNYVTQEQFDILKKRWEQELAAGCPSIDPRLVDTLKMFNKLPGVVSIWSCSGHTKEEQLKVSEKFESLQERYIIFAIRPGCEPMFEAFSNSGANTDQSDWNITRPHLKTCKVVWCFREAEDGQILSDDIGDLYPIWELSFNYHEYEDIPLWMDDVWGDLITALGLPYEEKWNG